MKLSTLHKRRKRANRYISQDEMIAKITPWLYDIFADEPFRTLREFNSRVIDEAPVKIDVEKWQQILARYLPEPETEDVGGVYRHTWRF